MARSKNKAKAAAPQSAAGFVDLDASDSAPAEPEVIVAPAEPEVIVASSTTKDITKEATALGKAAANTVKTVTLIGAGQIPDPGTKVVLVKGRAVIVPEISKWVRMQAKTQPPYLTFTE